MNPVIETFMLLYPKPTMVDLARFQATIEMQLDDTKMDLVSAMEIFQHARRDVDDLIARAEQIAEAMDYLTTVAKENAASQNR